MIEELSVRNLGVIEDATLHLSPGLTVVTGETGAGKTLLVTALQLLLGARSDSDLVRHGSDHAVVEANVLSPPPHATEWLEHPDDGLVVVREVRASGGSKARLGGRLVPVGTLQEALGTHVEVHAQHEHHRLTRPDVQRDLLDRFAGPDHLAVLADHREAHAAWTAATTEREELDRTVQERAREQDRLRAELDEIADARIDLEADDRLDDELARVEHADALREGLATASDALSADGAQDPLGVAVEHLRRLPVRDADLDDLRTRAESLAVEAQDLWRELRHAAEAVDADPDQLDRLMRRRQVLRALDRKYGPGLKRVVEYEAEARRRLADLDRAEHSASDLDERVAALDARVHELADRLTRGRQDAGARLGEEVARHLADLAMPHARFRVAVDPGPRSAAGHDQVTLQLAPNPGEPERPVGTAASGGERSRVLLALEVALADVADAAVLVFDEVDAGIGGATAMAVGAKLATLAREGRQVLCVTHLAQLAAHADVHHVVEKDVEDGRTVTRTRLVEDRDRAEELSRMLGGDTGPAGVAHAEALLDDVGAR